MSKLNSSLRTSGSLLAYGLAGVLWLSGCGGGGAGGAGADDVGVSPSASPASAVQAGADGTEAEHAAAAAVTLPGAPAAASEAATGEALVSTLAVKKTTSSCSSGLFGTFDRPFAADSPWNSRPVSPVLGSATIPTSTYSPSVSTGAYSSAAFKATASDGAMVVTGATSSGVWDPDSEQYRPSITIPRWPANTVPAVGADGHAEIVDTVTGIVHSFWKLKQVNGAWTAQQYAWTRLDGRGMGDPSHWFQGARAAGTSTLGGLIRIGEVNNGDTMYRHALAMSLTFNGLGFNPTYRFPATSSDSNAATANSGTIAMGSLMMLPASFNAQALATPELRKVAETLKAYGAYVVDRNTGTPFVIYVENGSDFKLHKNGWSTPTANDLEAIRKALRPLQSASGWVDGNGSSTNAVANTALNLISMRGSWYRTKGTVSGTFDTWRQELVFPPTTTVIEQANAGGRAFAGLNWATPVVGDTYRIEASTTGFAKFRLTISDKATNAVVYDSGDLSNGQSATFAWPVASFKVTTWAKSGTNNVEGTVSATLQKVTGVTLTQSSCTASSV